ncbi:MAG: bifunctional homocysteine S-methyltransferase/methylenetetrahydrofolate reductase [Firmicutes bacterium]|nr:bifunctional homocysteine S-methyltransferase/methylenetetrahydrofolate reductase [Bacillota bacterium]
MKSLAEALREGVWVADGGIGTWFLTQGVDARQLPLLALTHEDLVLRCHLEYLQAGAQILETHTFNANRSKLEALGLSANVGELHRRAAQLARHARDIYGEPAYILGSLGPLALPVGSEGVVSIERGEAEAIYREAVSGLLAGGVDGFIVETMSDLSTIEAAVHAIRSECTLPVVVSLAFSPWGNTLYGVTPEEAVEALLALPGGPPAAIGANCGSGPTPLLDAVIRMAEQTRGSGIPLVAYPNAGEPTMLDGHVHYPATPAYMAAIVPALRAAGCSVIGGCCGTTPEHIRAVRRTVTQAPEVRISLPAPAVRPEDGTADTGELRSEATRSLRDYWRRRFFVSVELDPPRGSNPARILSAARELERHAVDAINVADSPMARVRMGALAAARLIQENTALATILHFTTRDRNLMGLQSDLLGAHALGITNILCLTGDPPGLGDYAHATAVYDLDSVGLVKVLQGFNQGHDALNQPIGTATQFTIGVGVNPNAESLDAEVERLRRKIEAGAQFVMTQPIYAPEQWRRFWDKAGKLLSIPVVLGVMPLVSYRQAVYLNNEVPGIAIPEEIVARFESVQDSVALGVDLAQDLIQALRQEIQGVYLVPSFNRIEPLLPLIEAVRKAES